MPDLKGKAALITGASAGIGESTAKHFASLGCWLSLNGRNTTNLEKVAEACCALGLPRDKVLIVPGDVTVQKDVADVVQKTVNHFGKIDILVNSAGVALFGSIESASIEDFKQSWDVNFNGPLRMMKTAMPYLCQTKGSIVNVSSVSSLTAVQKIVPYAVTKAALDHLTRCTALENATYGVRVNTINPAEVKTLMMKSPGVTAEQHTERVDNVARTMHPLKRVVTPEEVARCIAFLVSDGAGFITGISVPIDGGALLTSSISGPAPFPGNQKTA